MDIGGSQSNILPAMRVYGNKHQCDVWLVLDGVVTTDAGQTGGGGSYFDYASFEEARMQTIANDVEVPNRGIKSQPDREVRWQAISTATASWEQTSHKFQALDLDANCWPRRASPAPKPPPPVLWRRRHRRPHHSETNCGSTPGWRGRQNSETPLGVFQAVRLAGHWSTSRNS